MVNNDKRNLFTFFILLVFALALIAVNSRGNTQTISVVFLVLAMLSYFVLDREKNPHLGITGKDWLWHISFGLMFALIFAFADVFLPTILPFTSVAFSLALFDISGFSVAVGFLALFIFAPGIEDIVRLATRLVVRNRLKKGKIAERLASAGFFTALHVFAFTLGFYVAVSSPFIAAFLFALYADQVAIWSKSLLAGFVLHSAVNIWITFRPEIIAAVATPLGFIALIILVVLIAFVLSKGKKK